MMTKQRSFQGAEISNIMRFRDRYESTKLVALTDNYRSTAKVLKHAREVITRGTERLERFIPDLDKTLTAHVTHAKSDVELVECDTLARDDNL